MSHSDFKSPIDDYDDGFGEEDPCEEGGGLETPIYDDLGAVITFLNGLAEDPDISRDLRILLSTSLSPCSEAIANHPLIPSSNRTLTCMDVVNALLGVIPSGDYKGLGRITFANDGCPLKFEATKPFVVYDPDYPGSIECDCGHPYERHWDWSDNDRFNCKYCGYYGCERFIPLAKQKTSKATDVQEWEFGRKLSAKQPPQESESMSTNPVILPVTAVYQGISVGDMVLKGDGTRLTFTLIDGTEYLFEGVVDTLLRSDRDEDGETFLRVEKQLKGLAQIPVGSLFPLEGVGVWETHALKASLASKLTPTEREFLKTKGVEF